jgi:hypothetical protein
VLECHALQEEAPEGDEGQHLSGRPDEQQGAPADLVHQQDGDHGEHRVDDAEVDGHAHRRSDLVAHEADDGCAEVDDGVDAEDLLEHGEGDADDEQGRIRGGQSLRSLAACSDLAKSSISWSSSSTSPSLRVRPSTSFAPSFFPSWTSQRGVCGTTTMPTANAIPGAAPKPSIQRQFVVKPFRANPAM